MTGQTGPSRPWQAEQEVDLDLARRLIGGQFPLLNPQHLAWLGAGWDNTVYALENHVFRFPRRQVALELMETEWKLLGALAPSLPLAIPRPLFAGVPAAGYPWPFAGYSLVPGRTACAAALSPEQRQAAAAALAGFLKILHGFDVERAQSLGVPGDKMGKVDFLRHLPLARQRLHQATELGLIVDASPYECLIAGLPPDLPLNRPVCLVHGDLYVRHLIVDEGSLSGVIDWGDAHLGDPAADLSVVFSFLPPSAHEDFWAVYGEVSAETLQLARFRALFHSLALRLYAHDVQDSDLARESALSLTYLAA